MPPRADAFLPDRRATVSLSCRRRAQPPSSCSPSPRRFSAEARGQRRLRRPSSGSCSSRRPPASATTSIPTDRPGAPRPRRAQSHIAVDATEDAEPVFTDQRTSVATTPSSSLLTTGDVLDDHRQAARSGATSKSGGGFAGVHSASDTEHDWPWYGGLVGAYFRAHRRSSRRRSSCPIHATPRRGACRACGSGPTSGTASPRAPGLLRILATLDEASYAPGDSAMGGGPPIAWSHLYAGGRAWYTAGGRTRESMPSRSFAAMSSGGSSGPPGRQTSARYGGPGEADSSSPAPKRSASAAVPSSVSVLAAAPSSRRSASRAAVRRPDHGPAARVLGLRRDGSERREWAPDDPDRNRSDRLAPGTADRPAEELVRTELGAALLALDLERGRAAARRTTGSARRAAVKHCGQTVGRSFSCVSKYRATCPQERTEGNPVAERASAAPPGSSCDDVGEPLATHEPLPLARCTAHPRRPSRRAKPGSAHDGRRIGDRDDRECARPHEGPVLSGSAGGDS